MDKSPEAFRTISEVAEMLGTPAHVLRFWESRFPQIRPVKRAGGRRYYRPADVMLLTGIKCLLHDQGMTIRGVQKILREQGVRQVAAMTGGEIPETRAEDSVADLEQALADSFGRLMDGPSIEVEPESATIIALETALRQPSQVPEHIIEPELPEDLLPDALATIRDPAMAPLPEVTELFGPPDGHHKPDVIDTDTPEMASIFADEAAPASAPPAVDLTKHLLDLARRLRRAKSARLWRRHSVEFAAFHARLASLHASLGPVEQAPILPLP